jgi:hypothetical protein
MMAAAVATLTFLGLSGEAHAALPSLRSALALDLGWSGLHITDLVSGVAGSIRGCLTDAGLLGSFWGGVDPSRTPGACNSGGSLVLDIAFLSLLVIGVIAVVRIRQRTEQNRLELARKYIEKGMNRRRRCSRRRPAMTCAAASCWCSPAWVSCVRRWSPAGGRTACKVSDPRGSSPGLSASAIWSRTPARCEGRRIHEQADRHPPL